MGMATPWSECGERKKCQKAVGTHVLKVPGKRKDDGCSEGPIAFPLLPIQGERRSKAPTTLAPPHLVTTRPDPPEPDRPRPSVPVGTDSFEHSAALKPMTDRHPNCVEEEALSGLSPTFRVPTPKRTTTITEINKQRIAPIAWTT